MKPSIDKATPRPWGKRSQCAPTSIFDAEDTLVASTDNTILNKQGQEQAATLIIEAVNSYDQLRTQNAALREALEDLIHQLPTDERLADFNLDKAERALEEVK